MTLITGSLESATAGPDLVAAIEAALTDHPAWTFVEGGVAEDYWERVWRCDGSVNAQGYDFHIGLGSNGDIELYHTLFEQWNATTKRPVRFPPDSSLSDDDPTADGSILGDADLTSSYHIKRHSISLQTGYFDYWIWVTNHGLWMWQNASTDGIAAMQLIPYAGFANAGRPLLVSGNLADDGVGPTSTSTAYNEWMLTRTLATTGHVYNYRLQPPGGRPLINEAYYMTLDIAIGKNRDPGLGNGVPASRCMAASVYNTAALPSGFLKGEWPDCVIQIPTNPSIVTVGDTLTLNGRTYTYTRSHVWVHGDEA